MPPYPGSALPDASLHQLGQLVGTAITVAFLCMVQTSATARSTSASAGDQEETTAEDFSLDLAAVGAGSLLAGLAGSFAVDASPPRTAVVASAGGRSQVANLTAVAARRHPPGRGHGRIERPARGRSGSGADVRGLEAFPLWRAAFHIPLQRDRVCSGGHHARSGRVRRDRAGSGDGRHPGAGPADRAWPPGLVTPSLAENPAPTIGYKPTPDVLQKQVPGVVVYLLYAPLWYGNAAHVADRIRQVIKAAPQPVHTLVLDGDAIPDIDYTGAEALSELLTKLEKKGIHVGIARASAIAHRDLRRSGLLDTIGPNRVFTNVDDAVRALSGPPPPGRTGSGTGPSGGG